jgi:hypothetical protein
VFTLSVEFRGAEEKVA